MRLRSLLYQRAYRRPRLIYRLMCHQRRRYQQTRQRQLDRLPSRPTSLATTCTSVAVAQRPIRSCEEGPTAFPRRDRRNRAESPAWSRTTGCHYSPSSTRSMCAWCPGTGRCGRVQGMATTRLSTPMTSRSRSLSVTKQPVRRPLPSGAASLSCSHGMPPTPAATR